MFKGFNKTLIMFGDNKQRLNEQSQLKLETTVDENLEYALPHIGKYWQILANIGILFYLKI